MCCTCISGRAEGIYGRHDNDRGPRHVEGGQTNRHVLSNSDETGNLTENKYFEVCGRWCHRVTSINKWHPLQHKFVQAKYVWNVAGPPRHKKKKRETLEEPHQRNKRVLTGVESTRREATEYWQYMLSYHSSTLTRTRSNLLSTPRAM